jgi:hypothetical protein
MHDEQKEIILQAIRQTEIRLEDLQSLATAAENRAFQFASATILLATLFTPFVDKLSNPLAAAVGIMLLIIAGGLSFFLTMPRKFHVRGHYWSEWEPHVTEKDSIESVLISQAAENDDRIRFNEKVLVVSAGAFRLSFLIALFGVTFCAFGQLVSIVSVPVSATIAP